MCGIAGGYWLTGSTLAGEKMLRALAAISHRGPDYQGYEALTMETGTVMIGHARLSVIDLSEAAQQPMFSRDRKLAIIFNGEIYNYLELRADLERRGIQFSTNSDTEVLLAAWSVWGADVLPRLNGMFAFVIVDRERQVLVAARDAFGIKPFYYARDQGSFRFASELPALRCLREANFKLNWQRAYDYLVHGEYDFGDDTFVEGVRSLTPGHMLTLDLRQQSAPHLREWWSPHTEHSVHVPFSEAVARFREIFLDNVRIHLRADVPLGAALSGGLDSSAIVCAMRYLNPSADIHTFSFISTGLGSEEHWVDRVNRHVGAQSHKVVVTPDELVSDLDDIIASQGEPFGSSSIYAQYRVFKLARESGMTVTLDGQGADELLGGYNAYPGQRVRSLLDQGRPAAAWDFLRAWSRWPGRSMGQGLKRIVGAYTDGGVHGLLRQLDGTNNVPSWINSGPLREAGVNLRLPLQENMYDLPERRMMGCLAASLRQRGLPALLRHGDRNSMRFSIESRVPFLTCQLADFTLGLPEEYLVSLRGESKHLLRAAMRGIVPDEVLNRGDKIGFATPEQQWVLGIADTVRGWLAQDIELPFLNQRRVVKAFDQVLSRRRSYTWQIWRWVNFIRWYRGFA